MKILQTLLLAAFASLIAASCNMRAKQARPPVRVAVIGGMTTTGLWQEVAKRFTVERGWPVQLVATGEREICADALQKGRVDLVTMHSGDITSNLVADGYAVNMRPWTRNDLVIVGPKADPAGIRGMKDGAAALRKVAETQSPYLDFQGMGSREMAHNLWKRAGIPNPQGDWVLKDESHDKWSSLKFAQERGAYLITGRLPVRSGKLPSEEMEILVAGDEFMRRPFMVLEANPQRFPKANAAGARALSDYLLSAETQSFLNEFGAKEYGGVPLFHPVEIGAN